LPPFTEDNDESILWYFHQVPIENGIAKLSILGSGGGGGLSFLQEKSRQDIITPIKRNSFFIL
jgi:hypothetical protein